MRVLREPARQARRAAAAPRRPGRRSGSRSASPTCAAALPTRRCATICATASPARWSCSSSGSSGAARPIEAGLPRRRARAHRGAGRADSRTGRALDRPRALLAAHRRDQRDARHDRPVDCRSAAGARRDGRSDLGASAAVGPDEDAGNELTVATRTARTGQDCRPDDRLPPGPTPDRPQPAVYRSPPMSTTPPNRRPGRAACATSSDRDRSRSSSCTATSSTSSRSAIGSSRSRPTSTRACSPATTRCCTTTAAGACARPRARTTGARWLRQALGDANPISSTREPGVALELIDRYLLRSLNLQAIQGAGARAAPQGRGRRPRTGRRPGGGAGAGAGRRARRPTPPRTPDCRRHRLRRVRRAARRCPAARRPVRRQRRQGAGLGQRPRDPAGQHRHRAARRRAARPERAGVREPARGRHPPAAAERGGHGRASRGDVAHASCPTSPRRATCALPVLASASPA